MDYKVPFEYKSIGYIVIKDASDPETAQDKAEEMLKELKASGDIRELIDTTPTAIDKRSICVNYLKSVIDENGNRYNRD